MFDQYAELEENRQLDKLLNVLATQTNYDSEDDSDEELSDCDLHIVSQDENEQDSTIAPSKFIVPALKYQPVEISQLASQLTLSNLFQNILFEEYDLITDCKDTQLKELMILNRGKHVQLKALIKKYKDILVMCNESLQYIQQYMQYHSSQMSQCSKLSNCGFPYFKIGISRPANNSDYFKKKANNIVNLLYDTKRSNWNLIMLKKLKAYVIHNYSDNIAPEEAARDINVKKKSKNKKIGNISTSFKEKTKHLHEEIIPDLGDNTNIDWNQIAEKHFRDPYVAPSLQGMWNNYVHPSINTSSFSDAENEQIISYLNDNQSPDWSELAKLLNTNRSAYLVCKQYQILSHLNTTAMEEMDKAMIGRINMDEKSCDLRCKPSWSNFPLSGSAKQADRYTRRERYLNATKHCHTGSFTIEEDMKILAYVSKYGTNFEHINEVMPSRSKEQIRARYQDRLCQRTIHFSNYKLSEDKAILEHVKIHGEKAWNLLTQKLPRYPAQLRHRYKRLKAKIAEDPNFDLASMTRRAGFEVCDKRQHFINRHLAVRNETEIGQILAKPLRRVRMHTDIDEQLVMFFSPTAQLKKTRSMRNISEDHLNDCITSVKTLLAIFQATLRIPKKLDSFSDLDKIDLEVLNSLRDEEAAEDGDIITVKPLPTKYKLIPPNVSSIQSLRFLLLQSLTSDEDANYVHFLNSDIRQFEKRFRSFFMLPSLLSIIEPVDTMGYIKSKAMKEKVKDLNPIPLKRKVGRPAKNLKKIHLMLAKKKAIRQEAAEQSAAASDVKLITDQASQIQQELSTSQSDAGLSFMFDGGKLIPCDSINLSPPVQPQLSLQSSVAGMPKVLVKLDQSTIQKLKDQNLLKGAKPIKVVRQKVNVSGKPQAAPTPNMSIKSKISKDEIHLKKRKADITCALTNGKKCRK